MGHRVHVIDYDASTGTFHPPAVLAADADPYLDATDAVLLRNPGFHAQNVYAIVMRTLARFEFALGRRISWGFYGHQLKIAPHAFSEANAFYSERDQALLFGYFPGSRREVHSCLSHDVIVHETTHAILDGIRPQFTDPSSPDQAAFHEGFADVVALLSVFSLRGVVEAALAAGQPSRGRRPTRPRGNRISVEAVRPESLRSSVLFGLAEQMGSEMSTIRGDALRRSAKLEPSQEHIRRPEFEPPHRRGEILVAAMINAFIGVWAYRLEALTPVTGTDLALERAAEEGAAADMPEISTRGL